MSVTYITGDPICPHCGRYLVGVYSHNCPALSYRTNTWYTPPTDTETQLKHIIELLEKLMELLVEKAGSNE